MATIENPQGPYPEGENYGNRDHNRGYGEHRPGDHYPAGDRCGEGPTATDKSIQRERTKVCDELKDKAGEVRQWEQTRIGANQLYNDKKCILIRTETNYQYYRNLELAVGVELMQVNEGLKTNVAAYKKWNDELSATLKELVKVSKEAKGKFAELKKAACDLDTCLNDSCQSTQRKILTGESYEGCRENDRDLVEQCNSKEILYRLQKEPDLFFNEIDLIFNSATRVSGIQAFSNIGTLDPLQKSLQEKSKAFDDLVAEKMKKGSDDLKKSQEELTKAIQELTMATSTLYFKRSDFDGVYAATRQLCECKCDCINTNQDEGRLERCKCYICDICDQVKAGVCREYDNPACRPDHQPDDSRSFTY